MASAAILAGGRASRFDGRDKSALVVGGRSIFERQLEALSRITDDILIVGARCPSNLRGDIAPRFVPDRVPGCGPLGGLDAALAAARDDAVVVVACDMPFVTAELLGHLLSCAPDHDVVVPCTERGYHPLCAVYTRDCSAAVARRLAEGRLTMIGLLEEVRVHTVTGDELDAFGNRHRLLANVNTLVEYEEIEALAGHEQ
jgi:molybdopterin-guanine dinucleotide biosynthesis protein A